MQFLSRHIGLSVCIHLVLLWQQLAHLAPQLAGVQCDCGELALIPSCTNGSVSACSLRSGTCDHAGRGEGFTCSES